MSFAPSSSDLRIHDTLRKATTNVKNLINLDLRRICKDESMPTSGVKSTLQERIIGRLRNLADEGDQEGLDQLSKSISPPIGYKPTNTAYAPTGHFVNSTASFAASFSFPDPQKGLRSNVMWKIDFMHEIRREVTMQRKLPAVLLPDRLETHRATFKIDPDTSSLLNDKDYRIMVLCGTDYDPNLYPNPIRFPTNMGLEINNVPYPKSLRAIKKKTNDPVHGADITSLIRKSGQYDKHGNDYNSLSISYGNTTVKYAFQVYLVYKQSIDSLVNDIQLQGKIPKARTMKEHFMKAEDDDIQAIGWDLSLKDQSTGMRITLPVKTPACRHVQCFDAEGFFMLFEQSPRSQCGINNCTASIKSLRDLAVDEYMSDILKSVGEDVDQVTINPDGTWKVKAAQLQPQPTKKKQRVSYNLDDSDDEPSTVLTALNDAHDTAPQWAPWDPKPLLTPSSTREPSTATSAVASSSGTKRKAPEVVDLTFSSDEEDDDPPIPQIKRSVTNEVGSGSGGAQLSAQQVSLPSRSFSSTYNSHPQVVFGSPSFGSPGMDDSPFSWPRG